MSEEWGSEHWDTKNRGKRLAFASGEVAVVKPSSMSGMTEA